MCNSCNRVAYICYENRKYIDYKSKIIYKLYKIFNLIRIEEIHNGILIFLPKKNSWNFNLNKILKKFNIKNIALGDNLLSDSINNKSEILDGKIIMKYFIPEIFDFISNKYHINVCIEDIYVLTNEYSKLNIDIIKVLANKCRCINIITENFKHYKKLESELAKEEILITVSNNKRKSLRKAKLILNLDFEQKLIEEYIINFNSIIINASFYEIYYKKLFNGVIVNNIEVKSDSSLIDYVKEYYGNFNMNVYLEGILISKGIKKVEEIVKSYNIKIQDLFGIRGKIRD